MRRSRRTQKFDRKYERFLMDLRLVVKTESGVLHGRTKNLAEGGMAATVAGEIPMGELVDLQFHLPHIPEPLVLRAEVRYRQGFQYGFRFLLPTYEQLELIRNTVQGLPLEE